MAGDNSYKPGEIVKVSGIFSVVHDDGKNTFEVTCVEGEHFLRLEAARAPISNSKTRRRTRTSTAN
ncbi:protein of unknown function (plasmid) [Caballeronia sp. S22]